MHDTNQMQASDESAQVDSAHDGGKAPASVVDGGLIVSIGCLYMLCVECAIDRLLLADISRLYVLGVSAGCRVCGHVRYGTSVGKSRNDQICLNEARAQDEVKNVVLHAHIFRYWYCTKFLTVSPMHW